MDKLELLTPPVQAIIGGTLTWIITALGAMAVLIFKSINRRVMNCMLGAAAGVMTASSFWSLLQPAIDCSEAIYRFSWIVPTVGFLCGGTALIICDKLFERLTRFSGSGRRCAMLIFSITLHNIPEGLAIGVAFASAGYVGGFIAACTLAVGIGIQNFPEGAAVSLPLRREGMSRRRSFIMGILSGVVEPISAFLGAILVSHVTNLMPFMLSFASGAMIYVVASELIPESQEDENGCFVSVATLSGFAVMMMLDVALG